MKHYTLCAKHGGRYEAVLTDSEREVVLQEQADSYSRIASKIIATKTNAPDDVGIAIDKLNGLGIKRQTKTVSDAGSAEPAFAIFECKYKGTTTCSDGEIVQGVS
jgi:hypothetical protein